MSLRGYVTAGVVCHLHLIKLQYNMTKTKIKTSTNLLFLFSNVLGVISPGRENNEDCPNVYQFRFTY